MSDAPLTIIGTALAAASDESSIVQPEISIGVVPALVSSYQSALEVVLLLPVGWTSVIAIEVFVVPGEPTSPPAVVHAPATPRGSRSRRRRASG
jgi:hypothetical protein